ncbi:MAG: hypothetical protein UHS41_07985 [Lachnospiraceae bacterium]|nr:hypothetical protein [Lachnospiraceae bacterium]
MGRRIWYLGLINMAPECIAIAIQGRFLFEDKKRYDQASSEYQYSS